MEFEDIVAGLLGFIVMFGVYLLIKLVVFFVSLKTAFSDAFVMLAEKRKLVFHSSEIEKVREQLADVMRWNEKKKIHEKIGFLSIPNIPIAATLAHKKTYADELGVYLNIDVEGDSLVNVNGRVLIDVSNILIDNAIETACFSNRRVSIFLNFHVEYFEMRVENQFVLESKQVLKYGKKNGLGLAYIESLCTDTFILEKEIIEDWFKIRIRIMNS